MTRSQRALEVELGTVGRKESQASIAGASSGRLLAIVLTLVVFSTAAVATAAKPPSPGGGGKCPAGSVKQSQGGYCIVPVTTYIAEVDASGLPATISCDGLGAYAQGVDGVTSWLTENGYNRIAFGDWQFGVYDSPSRLLSENLQSEDTVQPGDSHYTAPANPPFGFGIQASKAHIEVKCTLVNRSMFTMTAGQTFTCPLPNRFNVNGQDYALSPARSFTGFAETTDVQVRCNTANSGGCNDWFIDSIGLGQAVGRLVPTGTTINDGDFYMRFHIHITRP